MEEETKRVSKEMPRKISISEKPIGHTVRRLSEWLNPTGTKMVHSLVDKVYKRKNLEIAWERVRANKGSGGVDGISISDFEENLDRHLNRLHEELKTKSYIPEPVKRQMIPKPGSKEKRPLGIPTIYDRVCQQALLNRLEPIFDPVFDEASFGYRKGRSPKEAMRKIWGELQSGKEWIVDADLKNYFGSVDHDKLMTLINQQVSDGRVLKLLEDMLKAGAVVDGKRVETNEGTPQGSVISPLLSNIFLTPFDREMRERGFDMTRWADDWVVTCKTKREAEQALSMAKRILNSLGVTLHPEKTRIVHVKWGFEFLGYKVKKGTTKMELKSSRIKSGARQGQLYAFPREKSIQKFKDQIRRKTKRHIPLTTEDLIKQLNPIIRGWGNYYCKAHIRKLFNRLNRWIVRRIWSHKFKRWRNTGWKRLSRQKLYEEFRLVSLTRLIPSLDHPKGVSL